VTHPTDALKSYQRIRHVRDAETRIFYGHDAEVFKATKVAPDFYD
jgi:hypothetical protein